MFEDDSSSSEEENPPVQKNDVNSKGKDDDKDRKQSTAMAGLFDDSSNDDDSDDSDDDDAVFDDAGAVVGSSAPPSEKILASRGQVGNGNTDDDNEDVGTENHSKGNKASYRPPQNATVLQAHRPESGTSLYMTKLPNVVAVQPSAFDEAEYDEKKEEESYKGYVHNMVRWRYKRDENGSLVRNGSGKLARESNTKLVKWSDGSFTLHIGKEGFDIQNVDSSTSDGFTGLNGYVYLSQKATFRNDEDNKDDEEPNQNGETVLECIGPVASRLVAKPSSLQSESHKSLTVAIRQRTIKKAQIGSYMTEEDPEKLKQERIKYNDDAEKLQQRKRATASRNGGRRNNPGMNRNYLEASDDEGYDTVNIRRLKKGSNYDMDAMDDYGDDSDDDYGQSYANRNNKKRKKPVVEDSEDEEEMVFDEEDEEEVVTLHKKKKQSHAAVLDDDE